MHTYPRGMVHKPQKAGAVQVSMGEQTDKTGTMSILRSVTLPLKVKKPWIAWCLERAQGPECDYQP